MLALTHVRRLGYDLQESVLSFSCASPGDQTQVVWLRDFSGTVRPDSLPAAFKGVFAEALCSKGILSCKAVAVILKISATLGTSIGNSSEKAASVSRRLKPGA